MDELVELLELLLVVDILGVGGNSAQAIHDVVLHKHGGIAAHGKGNGVTGAGVDLALLAIGQYDDRRVEHRRLGANDLDALELGAQGVNGIEQQVMGDRALGATAIDAAADGSSFKRTSLNGRERSGAGESDLLLRSRSTISDGTGPAAMTMVSMSTRTMEHLRYVAVNTRQPAALNSYTTQTFAQHTKSK